MDDRRIVSDEALQQKPRASCRLAKVSPPVVSLERHGGHGESRLVWRSSLSRRLAISPPAIPSQIRDDPVVSYKCLRVPA